MADHKAGPFKGAALAAVPGMHHLNHARYLALDLIHRGRKAEGQAALLERLRPHAGDALAFTIAYNVPEAVALLVDAMGRFLPQTPLVVCDNSTDPAAKAAIARLCAERSVPYLAVPPAPLVRAQSSRSHAAALNWTLHNVIRPLAPKAFALLDHDLIPLAPYDLAAHVADQPVYGMVRHQDEATGSGPWYLWPGFSVFDGRLAKGPLDFGADRLLKLDTGGQNWRLVFRKLDGGSLARARTSTVRIPEEGGVPGEPRMLVDTWLHVGGASYRGGAASLDSVRRAFDRDPDGLLASLVAD